jgi:hypothetical protein
LFPDRTAGALWNRKDTVVMEETVKMIQLACQKDEALKNKTMDILVQMARNPGLCYEEGIFKAYEQAKKELIDECRASKKESSRLANSLGADRTVFTRKKHEVERMLLSLSQLS